MSRPAYPYPEDEFDAPADPDAPRGVHREPRSAWSRWWPAPVILLVVPAIAWGLVTFAARDGRIDDLVGGDGAGSAPAEAGVTDPAITDPAATDPAATDPAAAQPAPEPTSEEPAVVAPVLGTPVEVLNAAGISGLAGGAADALEAAGFTAVSTGNADSDLEESTVLYSSEDLTSTAQLVASTLGLTALTQSADAGAGIQVILLDELPG